MINVRWSSISLQLKHHNVYASRYMQKIHKYSWSLGIGGPFRVVNFVDSQVMNMQMTVLLQSVILFDYLKPHKRLVRTTKYLIDSRCGVEKPSHCDRTICINVAYIDFSYLLWLIPTVLFCSSARMYLSYRNSYTNLSCKIFMSIILQISSISSWHV